MVPGGRSAAAAAMSLTASLPASAAASSTTTRSSANSDGLNSSASSAVLTSPARNRFTGTSSVPACLRACRRTAAIARSASSSSSPNTRCRPAISSLTPRSCHARPTVPTPSTRAGTTPPHRLRYEPTATATTAPRRYRRQRHTRRRADPKERRRKHREHPRPTGPPQQPPQLGTGKPDQQLRARWPQWTHRGRYRADEVIGGITAATARLATTSTTLKVPDTAGHQWSGDKLSGDGDTHRSGQRLGPAAPDQAPRPDGRDHDECRVAETDSANPTSTASSGAAIISSIMQADNTGIACLPPMRDHGEQRDAAHHGRPQHAGRGLHDDDERHQRECRPARRPAWVRTVQRSSTPPRRRW